MHATVSESFSMPTKKLKEPPPELGNPEVGARLAKLRKEAGISQAQLAELLGTTQSHVSRFEKGQRRMYDDLLAETAKVLGVTPNDILGVGPCKPIKPEEATLSRRLIQRMKQIEALPRRSQDTVIGMIDLALKGARN
jgi:transcriptional regulator with XRE-family HTH domain